MDIALHILSCCSLWPIFCISNPPFQILKSNKGTNMTDRIIWIESTSEIAALSLSIKLMYSVWIMIVIKVQEGGSYLRASNYGVTLNFCITIFMILSNDWLDSISSSTSNISHNLSSVFFGLNLVASPIWSLIVMPKDNLSPGSCFKRLIALGVLLCYVLCFRCVLL